MKKKCVELPKPRALAVNEILRSKKCGKHQDHLAARSNRKSETKREINASLKGSKWSPFFIAAKNILRRGRATLAVGIPVL